MIDSPEDIEQLRMRLQNLARRIRRTHDQGITDCSLAVLMRLERGDLSPGELAGLEHVTPPSMNRTLNALSEAGLVERHRDHGDGRRVRVTLTPAGAERARLARTSGAEWFAEGLRALDDRERAVLDAAIPVLEHLAGR